MSEKMTDEQWAIYSQMPDDMTVEVGPLRAHVAALTAERDEEEKKRGFAESALRRYEKRLGDDLRCWVKDDPGSLPFNWTPADVAALQSERDALRERGKVLEAARAEEGREADAWARRAHATESSLAAIRQRARDETALIRKGEVCAIMGFASEWDDATHNEVVERGDFNTVRDVALGVARHIVGDDAPAPSEMDGLRGEMAEVDCDVDGKGRAVLATTPVTPSTYEAFATVRADLDARDPSTPGSVALSLLERRTGAMAWAIRDALVAFEVDYPEDAAHTALPLLRAALTDAPPVFTLEEVRKAIAGQGLSDEVDAEILERLAALRR